VRKRTLRVVLDVVKPMTSMGCTSTNYFYPYKDRTANGDDRVSRRAQLEEVRRLGGHAVA